MIVKKIEVYNFPELGDISIDMEVKNKNHTQSNAKFLHDERMMYSIYMFAHTRTGTESTFYRELMRLISYMPYLTAGSLSAVLGDDSILRTNNPSSYFMISIDYYRSADSTSLNRYRAIITEEGFSEQRLLTYKAVPETDSGEWVVQKESSKMSTESILAEYEYPNILYFHAEASVTEEDHPGRQESQNPHSELHSELIERLKSQRFKDFLTSMLNVFQVYIPSSRNKIRDIDIHEHGDIREILLHREIDDPKRTIGINLSGLPEQFAKMFMFIGGLALCLYDGLGKFYIANDIDRYLNSYQMKMVFDLISSGKSINKSSQFIFSIHDPDSVGIIMDSTEAKFPLSYGIRGLPPGRISDL